MPLLILVLYQLPSSANQTQFKENKMTQRILITNNNGASIGVIVPAPDATAEFCLKDVPVGSKYKIVDANDVPSDRTFRDAWEETDVCSWKVKA